MIDITSRNVLNCPNLLMNLLRNSTLMQWLVLEFSEFCLRVINVFRNNEQEFVAFTCVSHHIIWYCGILYFNLFFKFLNLKISRNYNGLRNKEMSKKTFRVCPNRYFDLLPHPDLWVLQRSNLPGPVKLCKKGYNLMNDLFIHFP
jgi:hypothetical protein